MQYIYKVAGFYFAIDMSESEHNLLTNYEPFAVNSNSEELLFSLTIDQNYSAPIEEKVFTDSSDDDMPRIEICRTKDGWLIEESVLKTSPLCLHLYATTDFKRAWLRYEQQNVRFAIDNAAMLLFAFATAKQHTLEMHASVTIKDGYGYMFLGKSGTGKSTHSRMWLNAFPQAWLLNDDNPIVRLQQDEQGRVQAFVYGSPWSGKTPCYKNQQAPIGAIVKLAQAPYNKIHPLRLPEAYAYILSSASGLKIVPEMMDALYETIAQLIQTIQVYGMECLPDTDAALVCAQAVEPK